MEFSEKISVNFKFLVVLRLGRLIQSERETLSECKWKTNFQTKHVNLISIPWLCVTYALAYWKNSFPINRDSLAKQLNGKQIEQWNQSSALIARRRLWRHLWFNQLTIKFAGFIKVQQSCFVKKFTTSCDGEVTTCWFAAIDTLRTHCTSPRGHVARFVIVPSLSQAIKMREIPFRSFNDHFSSSQLSRCLR